MSAREDVLAAIAAILVTASVAGGRIYRTRQESIVTMPAVNVEPVSDQVDQPVIGRMDHMLRVAVNVFASGDTPDNAADATLDAVITTVLGNPTLGIGNSIQVHSAHEISWDFSDFDIARATVIFNISIRTAL